MSEFPPPSAHPRSTRSRFTRLFALFGALVVMSLVMVGCSGEETATTDGVATLETAGEQVGDAADATTEEPEVSDEDAVLDFSQCMRDEGLDFPDIGLTAEGTPNLREGFEAVRGQEGFRDAMDACSTHLESLGLGGGRAAIAENVEIQDAFVEFSQCVRDAGYDVGDFQIGGGPGAGAGPGAGDGAGDGDGTGEGAPDTDGPGEGERPDPNAEGGRGQDGFDPTRRLANGLGLDPDDPDVQATLEECSPILEEAFASAGVGPGRN